MTSSASPAVTPRARWAPASSANRNTRGGLLIALGALGISLLVLAPIAMMGLRRDAATLSAPAVTFDLAAETMRFSQSELRVPAGASVRVNFTNRDPSGPHDFQSLGQYRDSRVVLWPGEQRSTVFIAIDKPGRYPFICTVRGHAEAGMTGVIIVE